MSHQKWIYILLLLINLRSLIKFMYMFFLENFAKTPINRPYKNKDRTSTSFRQICTSMYCTCVSLRSVRHELSYIRSEAPQSTGCCIFDGFTFV